MGRSADSCVLEGWGRKWGSQAKRRVLTRAPRPQLRFALSLVQLCRPPGRLALPPASPGAAGSGRRLRPSDVWLSPPCPRTRPRPLQFAFSGLFDSISAVSKSGLTAAELCRPRRWGTGPARGPALRGQVLERAWQSGHPMPFSRASRGSEMGAAGPGPDPLSRGAHATGQWAVRSTLLEAPRCQTA